jgi:putative redox protein
MVGTEEVVMTSELCARVALEDGMRFLGTTRSGYTVHLDAPSPAGGSAPSPMELLLLSLAGCSAMDVIAILRKMRQPVEHLEVRARGQRRDEHPTIFTAIHLEYVAHGAGVDGTALARAIELSRERYCPVWAMLGPSVGITSAFRVLHDEPILVPAD